MCRVQPLDKEFKMTTLSSWSSIWRQVQRRMRKQPPCITHPKFPSIKTLARETVNDVIDVRDKGITLRSHEHKRKDNENRFFPQERFRKWWTDCVDSGGVTTTNKARRERHEAPNGCIVDAVMVRCLDKDYLHQNSSNLKRYDLITRKK